MLGSETWKQKSETKNRSSETKKQKIKTKNHFTRIKKAKNISRKPVIQPSNASIPP